VVRLVYEIINRILYFKDNEFGLRLYILSIIEVEVFKLTYNEIGYPGYILRPWVLSSRGLARISNIGRRVNY